MMEKFLLEENKIKIIKQNLNPETQKCCKIKTFRLPIFSNRLVNFNDIINL